MDLSVEVVFENGVFRPLLPVDLPEHARGTVSVSSAPTSTVATEPAPERDDDIVEWWTEEDDRILAEIAAERRNGQWRELAE